MSDSAQIISLPPAEDREKVSRKTETPVRYVEFAVASNFSFLRGASSPEELIGQAASRDVGLNGMGLCDRNSVAGVVRAHLARRENKLALGYHPGVRLVFADGTPDILAYPRDRPAWGRLCRLLTQGNLRAEKGDCILTLDDLIAHAEGLELIVMPACTRDGLAKLLHKSRTPFANPLDSPPPLWGRSDGEAVREGGRLRLAAIQIPPSPPLPRKGGESRSAQTDRISFALHRLQVAAPGRVRLAAATLYRGNDKARLAARAELARKAGIPLIAVNDVLYHHFERRPLQDVLTCIREHVTIDSAGRRLAVNAERYLKPPAEMARLFQDFPEAIAETLRLSDVLSFTLDDLKSEYPDERRQGFATPQEALEHYTWQGAAKRYPKGIPPRVSDRLKHEFSLISSRLYAPYFLTVHHIVQFARSRDILCQGRGSAANSAVCFCLGITEVNPDQNQLLFERFISENRGEPPDIDVDFEHERREEVIQHIYDRYSREHTGIAATVICYRGRSAIREVGKAFGLSEDMIGALASSIWGMGGGNVRIDTLRRAGLDPDSPRVAKIIALAKEIQGFPRHLSQHVGGFVITRSRLDDVIPIMNGAMEKRTHVEWDKDDLDALGMLKVDVLGLGMLTCIRKALALIGQHYGKTYTTIASIPSEQKAVYRMLCRADSLGVFQVESRAQMTMLPRLKPQRFYDLVIEVAIVRPGPIQGDMVHPYLRRREGVEKVVIPSPRYGKKDELYKILKRTLGVPLFQEQAMKIAIDAGGFLPAEADKLRRAMATFKRTGTIQTFRDKMVEGMTVKGYERDFAERCFSQIEGFGEYGFPESHAASFALLVYASAWLKCRYPDVFAAALLNSQPMGFYAPAQIVRDAREHGVEVRPIDVNFSDYDATLEPGSRAAKRVHDLHKSMKGDIRATHAMRLGLRAISGLSEKDAERIVKRRSFAFTSPLEGEVDHCRLAGNDREGGDLHVAASKCTPLPNPPPQGGRERVGIPEQKHQTLTKIRIVDQPRMQSSNLYTSIRDLWLRTGLNPRVLERLADADAFGSLGLTRRQALWAVKALGRAGDQDDLPLLALPSLIPASSFTSPLEGEVDHYKLACNDREGGNFQIAAPESAPLPNPPPTQIGPARFAQLQPKPEQAQVSWGREQEWREPHVALPPMSLGEEVVNDYRFTHLSLKAHPASFLRKDLTQRGIVPNDTLRKRRSGDIVSVSGLVTVRQRPGSANGVVFMTIEDETSVANIIVWPKMLERFRPIVLGARYVAASGPLQSEKGVIHVIAHELKDLTSMLASLTQDLPPIEAPARADEVKHGSDERPDSWTARQRARIMINDPEIAGLAADLDATSPGSAHTPTRRRHLR